MSKIKLLIAGDWHGNLHAGMAAIDAAVRENCELIVQLGDFGVWPGYSGVHYLDSLNYRLENENRKLVFVGGNHEDYNQIEAWEKVNARSTNGHVYVRSNILYIPRGCVWKWNNKRFLALGGAVSIDKEWREPNESWWWQEAITNEQMAQAVENVAGRQIDYMFTHDCSDKTPWKDRLKDDLDSKTNRRKVDWVLDRVKPKMQFHGHFHTWYDWQLTHGVPFDPQADDAITQVYGLNMEMERNAMGVLDLDTNTFSTTPWKMPRPNVL